MNVYSVFDKEFAPYGRVVKGLDKEKEEILSVLKALPLPESGTTYVAAEKALEGLFAKEVFSHRLYGGMPVQMGFCGGRNTKLNALEYHRDSEFNLCTDPIILLVAGRWELREHHLNTGSVKAFRVPAGCLIECYATTLHYCPCAQDSFRMLVALPQSTNTSFSLEDALCDEDPLLFARNKWLIAHADSPAAKKGAFVGLDGENLEVTP